MADKEKDAATALAVDGYLECRGCGDKLTARVANIVADEMGQDRLIFAREELERAEAKGWQIIYEGNSICPECAGRCDNALLKPVGRTCLSRHFPFDLARLRRRAVFRHCTALPPLRLPRFRGIFGLPGRRRTLALGSKVAFRARFSCWAHGIPLEYHDADHFEGIVESW